MVTDDKLSVTCYLKLAFLFLLFIHSRMEKAVDTCINRRTNYCIQFCLLAKYVTHM